MISKVRSNIINKMGGVLKFRFNGSRNQVEEFEGIIKEVYNYIFIIKTTKNEIKSYSFSDVLIGNLEILN